MQRIRASLIWPWTAGWVPIISRACMVVLLAEGRPPPGGRYLKSRPRKTFWLSGNTNLALPVRMDLIHRNAIFPPGYVNETRDFVMELCFPSRVGLCKTGPVKRSIHLCRLLAVLVIVGLVIAPLTARANTGATASMAMTSMSDGTAAMSEDMPRCPDKSAPR